MAMAERGASSLRRARRVHATDAEWDAILDIAADEATSASAFIIAAALDRPAGESAAAIRDRARIIARLTRAVDLLGRIAARRAGEGSVADRVELLAALSRVERILIAAGRGDAADGDGASC